MKRLIALLLCICLCLSLFPASAFAEEEEILADIVTDDVFPDAEWIEEETPLTMDEVPVEAEEAVPDELAEVVDSEITGKGSEDEPFVISSEAALRDFARRVNEGNADAAKAYAVLTEDIELSDAWTLIGTAEHPFRGCFDGKGRKIYGLTAGGGTGCFGLFGVTENAKLSRLALENVNIQAAGYETVGAIVGLMRGGSLTESYVSGTVNASGSIVCGGLVGKAEGAELRNCFSAVEMNADGCVGGLIGFGYSSTAIGDSYNIGYIYSADRRDFGSVLGGQDGSVSLESTYCIDTTDKNAEYLTRLSAAEASSFSGFDFDRVWTVGGSLEYPYPILRISLWQGDAKWAPDYVEHPTGFIDSGEPDILLSGGDASGEIALSGVEFPTQYRIPNLPEVRNQGSHGTCWAHAMVAAAETNLIKKGYADPSINLSELQLAWYHHTGTLNDSGKYEDPLNNFGGDHNIIRDNEYGIWCGDSYVYAARTLASWVGLVSEDEAISYSMTNAERIESSGLDYSYAFSRDAVHLENAYVIPDDISAMKNAVLTYGALCILYYSDNRFYSGGNKYYYTSKKYDTNHAVAIVGWDDTVSKDLFYDSYNGTSPSRDGAWIVRNSWGEYWGDSGYFYMSYEAPYSYRYAFDFEKADKYDKCYQYDGSSGSGSITVYGSRPSAANIFTATENETISAVSFWYSSADFEYRIKVYTGLTGAVDPSAGTLAVQIDGKTPYSGYHTVELPVPVSVRRGQRFSVVLEAADNSSYAYFLKDSSGSVTNGRSFSYSKSGQSFYSPDGSSWSDAGINNGGNFRIKAFTAADSDQPVDPTPEVIARGDCGESLTWTLDTEGTLTISGVGAMPEYRNEEDVPWRLLRPLIRTVKIDSGITTISPYAFYNCDWMTGITIPDSVSLIGDYAFSLCGSLTSVMLPDGVTSIGDSAFYYCDSLTSVTIPDGVTSIGSYAFYYCDSLTSVTIGKRVTSIGSYAFNYCRGLTSVMIPDSVTSIGDSAFYYCDSLTSVTIGSSVTTIGGTAFRGCSSLTSVTIPDSVTSIGDYAFCECGNLTSVTIGSSVTGLGDSVFSNCSSLTSVTIPDSVTSIGDSAFFWCRGLTSVTIGSSVTSIGSYAFYYCSSLRKVTLSNSVTSISDYAFYACGSLAHVYYSGTAEQWSAIKFGSSNDPLMNAKMHWGDEKLIPGDVNDDGAVNTIDFLTLQMVLSGYDVFCNPDALDIDGNDEVNADDLTRLMQYLAGAAVEIY